MELNEISTNVLKSEDKNKVMLIIGIISLIFSFIFYFISFYFTIGLILFSLIWFFIWKSKEAIFDKNQNAVFYKLKTIRKKEERKISFDEIKEVFYFEGWSDRIPFSKRKGTPTLIKEISLILNNDEKIQLFFLNATQNPLSTKLRDKAQKIADFIDKPLKVDDLKSKENTF
jgi:hypothetical protein